MAEARSAKPDRKQTEFILKVLAETWKQGRIFFYEGERGAAMVEGLTLVLILQTTPSLRQAKTAVLKPVSPFRQMLKPASSSQDDTTFEHS